MSGKDNALVTMNRALLQVALYSPDSIRPYNVEDIYAMKKIARDAALASSQDTIIDLSHPQVILTEDVVDGKINIRIDGMEVSEKNLYPDEMLKAVLLHFKITCNVVVNKIQRN